MEERYIYKIPVGFEAEIEEDMVVMHPRKESEDERIGKEIIEYIKVSKPYWSDFKDYRSWVAWLEKQKELERIVQEREATDFEIEVHEIIAQARSDKRLADKDVLEQFEQEAACVLMWKAEKQLRNAEKQKEQKPAEWSEEDKKYLNQAINIVVSDFGEDSPTVLWLKSLRPQPHWKPSEKQMEMLKWSVDHPDDPVVDELWELYNDLKKLM